MITAVIFDVGEVIFTGMRDIEEAIAGLLSLNLETVSEAMHGPHLAAAFHGQITEDEYWQSFSRAIRRDCDIACLKKTAQEQVREVPGTRAVIESLRRQYYQLGLLSVHVREWVEFCEKRFRFHNYFSIRQYSFEIGLCKPDPRVYLKILEDLNCPAKDAVFIDDRTRNVQAARDLGIQGIQFENAEKLRRDLAALGITV